MIAIIFHVFLLSFFLDHNKSLVKAVPMLGHNIRPAEPNEFPFIVSIGNRHYRKKGKEEEAHECGGSLVTRIHVLTSAHCLRNIKYLGDIEIIVGSVDLRAGEIYRIYDAITFKVWAENMCLDTGNTDDDVAILELQKCVGQNIKIPKIINEANLDSLGPTAITAGWGRTEEGNESRFLRTASLNVLSKAKCDEELHKYIVIERICTKNDPYTLIDNGDSGGPLMNKKGNVIIGINDSTCPSRHLRPNVTDDCKLNLHLFAAHYKKFIASVTRVSNSKCTIL